MPEALRAPLHKAAAQADAEKILLLIGKIDAINPSLANELRKLVNDFRFDILMNLTTQVGV
ncbi:MAG: hypothetical protein N2D54_02740, partial [Chloroflexota bacterium]